MHHFTTGQMAAFSYATVPAVAVASSTSQALAGKQFAKFYNRGHALGPTLAVLGAGTFSWLALTSHNALYWGAAALDIAIVPWTFAFMMKTNVSILKFADAEDKESSSQGDARLTSLMQKWTRLNFIRSLFPLAAGILGLSVVLV